MSGNTVFSRYEIKYLITKEQKNRLLEVMDIHMKPDDFGKSTICNIYFDTPDKVLIRRSLEKPCYKEKLRLRSYGVSNPESTVFLEIKKKYKGVVYKGRIKLDEKSATRYLVGHVPLIQQNQISKEIDYVLYSYKNLEPSVFLSYEREAFFSMEDGNFRMTFDENILMREYDMLLTSGIYGNPVLSEDMVVLEVKTVLGIPDWLLNFLDENKLYKTSYSKYGNAYMNLMLPKLLENSPISKDRIVHKTKEKRGVNNVA